ncbi:DUF2147 domain-containing protein, partial [Escherichia coli]|uniref:DUF2147 domain-containing protein n=1 Tax=Escherichia coli TaxID=562 RepID=UPI001954DD85
MFGLAAAATLMLAAPAAANDPRGTWLSQSGETRVRFADCGGQLCGTIVSASGQSRDEKNEDAALRGRS